MVTIKQVAKRAGVSFKTVSRVVNNDPTVKPENREKILAAIEELGYQPNIAARMIRKKKSDVIGFISDEISTTPSSVDIIRGAQDMAWEKGKTLMVFNLNQKDANPAQLFDECTQHRAEGVIYGAMYHQAVELPETFSKLPTVMVNCFDPLQKYPAIVPDDRQAAYYITRQLLAKGYKRIAFLNLNPDIIAAKLRLAGFQQALTEHGLDESQAIVKTVEQVNDNEVIDVTREVTLDVLENFKPDAILCGKDLVAVRVYFVLESLKMKIGKDIGVASFDNWDVIPDILVPGLSTMSLPYYEMGRRAVQKIIQAAADKEKTQLESIEPERITCLLASRASF
ncbi:LacI family DNA-binding transcriptional regulator [Catenovulum sp. 2E275]|uniref:LacI family DNA-binding transcriptional regulator n=1 Tax=Catenovulum sp. 2E275 TaxID=2980497 RepID=UPI0021CE888E|nr:LacI family DNA-binding transcriptional regulator [Catenovulum sp. 2E275]MCU4677024.1 LacI family DNA-binding transcriptional regulator [Catenovulum sp. 2E275]